MATRRMTRRVALGAVSALLGVSLTLCGTFYYQIYRANAAVQSVFSRAMEHFGTTGQANYALFTEQNAEINLQQSLRDAGITDAQRLVLRPREVRSGVKS